MSSIVLLFISLIKYCMDSFSDTRWWCAICISWSHLEHETRAQYAHIEPRWKRRSFSEEHDGLWDYISTCSQSFVFWNDHRRYEVVQRELLGLWSSTPGPHVLPSWIFSPTHHPVWFPWTDPIWHLGYDVGVFEVCFLLKNLVYSFVVCFIEDMAKEHGILDRWHCRGYSSSGEEKSTSHELA